jgi:rfaE bifunctional protein nucleotidyltransferase chain/domain
MGKIKTLEELAEVIHNLKQDGKKVVHCHGCFDLLHLGHIKHFEAAKKEGDILVVTITDDPFVNKGPGRPVFTAKLRAEALAALECVSYVSINPAPDAVELLKKIKPSLYVKGSEYENALNDPKRNLSKEAEAIRSVGGNICFTHEPTFSSTNLLKEHFNLYPDEVKTFLDNFSKRYSAEDLVGQLASIKKLKVLLIGEAVIDEYCYCSSLGKSGKENLIAMKFLEKEEYAGGIFACANHIAGFCEDVNLLTCLGSKDSRAEFIIKNLKTNIKTKFFFRDDTCTTIKKRYVEKSFLSKLFSVYHFNDADLPEELSDQINDYLEKELPKYDLVLVLDYAHGFLNPKLIDTICKKSKFLSVNTQTNAANFGYNLITKYPRADYVCIDLQEARLAMQDRRMPIEDLLRKIKEKTGAKKIIVTTGHKGSTGFDAEKNEFYTTPVLSWKVVDRMGAGDAFLAVTSPCVAAGLPMDLVGFIGNAVGAFKVGIVGNKSAVEHGPLLKFIKTLLK